MAIPSIQQLLADALLQQLPSAEVKKINKDNYVDIHLPWVHPKRGTHLGFNTAGGIIKVVFYCREEEFVKQALTNGGVLLERYSQGIRIKGNPEFLDVTTAIAATLQFIEALEQNSMPSMGADKPNLYTFDQAVKAYLLGNMDYTVAYSLAGNPVLQFNGDTLITNELISYVSAFTEVDQRIKALVEAGADLDASFDDGEGYTAVHFAAWDGKDQILSYLLEAGAQADVVGEDGYTPLFLAAAGGHLKCVEILVEEGADVNRRLIDDNIYFSKQGGTPLTMAFINGFLELSLFLIDSGADPFVLTEPCKNAPSPDLFVNFSSLVKQGVINLPLEGQLENILSLVGKAEDENSTGEDDDQEAQKSSGQLDLNEFLKEMGDSLSEASNKEAETAESQSELELTSFLARMEMGEESSLDKPNGVDDDSEDEEDGGFPMISFRKPADEMVDVVQQYLRRWQKSSQVYAWRMGIKAYVPEFVEALVSDKVCPIFTTKEIDEICARIRSEKIIPVLDYVPEELYNHSKRVWWLVPLCIWKEDVASLVFVDKNGFYALFSKDGEEDINMIFNWDSVDELDFEYEYDGDSNINRLILTQESGGCLTFDEFVSTSEEGDHGSYLAVIEAIWEARKETIQASKGAPMWYEGKGGEGFVEFESPQDLLKASNWDNPNRPDSKFFGG